VEVVSDSRGRCVPLCGVLRGNAVCCVFSILSLCPAAGGDSIHFARRDGGLWISFFSMGIPYSGQISLVLMPDLGPGLPQS
jgi:hypothetical protein